jgi:8-oxo-dGTP pyrophosphatase MutT (NUDIX family)
MNMIRVRAGVIIVKDESVALIQRVNARGTYYIFPGGGIEAGESIEEAAVREAWEELGVRVRLAGLLAFVEFGYSHHHYYRAHIKSGTFGSGTGAELSSEAGTLAGTYTPMWLPLARLYEYNVRPIELAEALQDGSLFARSSPLHIHETPL